MVGADRGSAPRGSAWGRWHKPGLHEGADAHETDRRATKGEPAQVVARTTEGEEDSFGADFLQERVFAGQTVSAVRRHGAADFFVEVVEEKLFELGVGAQPCGHRLASLPVAPCAHDGGEHRRVTGACQRPWRGLFLCQRTEGAGV